MRASFPHRMLKVLHAAVLGAVTLVAWQAAGFANACSPGFCTNGCPSDDPPPGCDLSLGGLYFECSSGLPIGTCCQYICTNYMYTGSCDESGTSWTVCTFYSSKNPGTCTQVGTQGTCVDG